MICAQALLTSAIVGFGLLCHCEPQNSSSTETLANGASPWVLVVVDGGVNRSI